MATDLHEAAQRGDVAALRRLLDGGAAIVAKDSVRPLLAVPTQPPHPLARSAGWQVGETQLHDAARNGHSECAALLLDRGAAIEAKNIVLPAAAPTLPRSPARALGGLAVWSNAAALCCV